MINKKNEELGKNKANIPLSFHETFIPERKYIASIMEFAAKKKSGDIISISQSTGIPTGKSSGKVKPTIRYSIGMGLIRVEKEKSKPWQLSLSLFGEIVKHEDTFLSEELTQWMVHILLCRRDFGAEAWSTLFADSALALGNSFSNVELKNYLKTRLGQHSSLPGPIVRMYNDSASFLKCGVLVENSNMIKRKTAPQNRSFYMGYAFIFFMGWDFYFANQQQILFEDYELKTRLFATLGWSIRDCQIYLDWLVDNQILNIDRQTGAIVLLRITETNTVLKRIYNDLI